MSGDFIINKFPSLTVKENVMDNQYYDSATPRPDAGRVIDAPIVEISILNMIRQIKSEDAWKNGDHNAITVFKTDNLQIVILAMHKGAEMKEYAVKCMMSLLVIEGLILFTASEKTTELTGGQLLALHANLSHKLLAKEETVLMLTLSCNEN